MHAPEAADDQPGELADLDGVTRCPELARTDAGWSRCHRAADPGHEHHVPGRAWLAAWGGRGFRLTLGAPCDAACIFEPATTPYRGTTPRVVVIPGSRSRRATPRTAQAVRTEPNGE
jgi:hypothetical protein